MYWKIKLFMMESFETTGNPEIDTLLLVLKEILEELQELNKMNADEVAAINQLTTKVSRLQEKQEVSGIQQPLVNTQPFQEALIKGITDLKIHITSQPKNFTRKFQILLFPERDAQLFYKVIFGRWFLWLGIMLFFTNLYKWSIHWSDNRKEIEMKQMDSDKIHKAWDYLYQQKNRDLHHRMDSALGQIQRLK